MKRVLKTAFLLILVFCFSCEERPWYFMDCNDCLTSEPENATLDIKLKETGSPVLINLYEGFLEDDILYDSASTTRPDYEFTVSLNKTYTVTATYMIDGKTYIAVDSATPRVRYDEDKCDDPCYFIYNTTIDLKLKSTVEN